MGEKRNELRGKLLASKKQRRFKTVTVDVDGEQLTVEVRAPSLATENSIKRAAMKIKPGKGEAGVDVDFDQLEQKVQACLCNVYEPGTSDRVFEPADAEMIRQAEVGSWLDTLSDEAVAIMTISKERREEIRGNSDTTPTAS